MGCCCLDHRVSQPYTTLMKLDAETGDEILNFDLLHPLIGDQAYSTGNPSLGGNEVSAWIANGFVYQACLVNPTGFSGLLVACFAVDSPSTIWVSKVSGASGTNVRLYADNSYVWVGTDNNDGWCFAAADGDIVGSTTTLDSNSYLYMTSGASVGRCQFSPLVEYDHEFTETNTSSIMSSVSATWLVNGGTEYLVNPTVGKIYTVSKSDISSSTLVLDVTSMTLIGGSDSVIVATDPTDGPAGYNYSGAQLWTESSLSGLAFRGYSTDGIYFRASNKLRKIDPTDGSTDWNGTPIIPEFVAPYRGELFDSVNSQMVVQGAGVPRPHDTATGAVNWAATRACQEFHLPGDGYLYCPVARQSI